MQCAAGGKKKEKKLPRCMSIVGAVDTTTRTISAMAYLTAPAPRGGARPSAAVCSVTHTSLWDAGVRGGCGGAESEKEIIIIAGLPSPGATEQNRAVPSLYFQSGADSNGERRESPHRMPRSPPAPTRAKNISVCVKGSVGLPTARSSGRQPTHGAACRARFSGSW